MSQHAALIDAASRAVRRGQLTEAQRLVDEIRSTIDLSSFSTITMSLMVVEGSLLAYRGEWDKSIDRLERARVLATHTRDTGIELLAASWLSYVAFLQSDLERSVELACSVLSRHQQADPYALFRASAMLALTLYFVGKFPEGDEWFKYCRRRAEELNDTSVTSALIFDIAAMKASCRRFESLSGMIDESDVKLDRLFASSSRNFDQIGSIHVMPSLHSLLEGQISNLLGAYEDARTQLMTALSSQNSLPSVATAQARLELLWARSRASNDALDQNDISAARHDIIMLIDDDDIAFYSKRVSLVCRQLDLIDQAHEFEALSERAIERHMNLVGRLEDKLKPLIGSLASVVSG